MGRPRKPTVILEASGAFAKNPDRGRARANEPKPTEPLGDPPKWLKASAIDCWNDLVAAICYPLTKSDAHMLAMTAMLEAKVRDGTAGGAEQNLYTKCLGKFGLSPADRSNVQVAPATPKNEFTAP